MNADVIVYLETAFSPIFNITNYKTDIEKKRYTNN